jgi:ribosomal protein S12 methylthiotransferase accessory factor
VADLGGLIENDIYKEFVWIRKRLVEAGVGHLIAVNLTRDEIRPAHVVRVVLPGLETTNPFYCGPRARLALVSDMISYDWYERHG